MKSLLLLSAFIVFTATAARADDLVGDIVNDVTNRVDSAANKKISAVKERTEKTKTAARCATLSRAHKNSAAWKACCVTNNGDGSTCDETVAQGADAQAPAAAPADTTPPPTAAPAQAAAPVTAAPVAAAPVDAPPAADTAPSPCPKGSHKGKDASGQVRCIGNGHMNCANGYTMRQFPGQQFHCYVDGPCPRADRAHAAAVNPENQQPVCMLVNYAKCHDAGWAVQQIGAEYRCVSNFLAQ